MRVRAGHGDAIVDRFLHGQGSPWRGRPPSLLRPDEDGSEEPIGVVRMRRQAQEGAPADFVTQLRAQLLGDRTHGEVRVAGEEVFDHRLVLFPQDAASAVDEPAPGLHHRGEALQQRLLPGRVLLQILRREPVAAVRLAAVGAGAAARRIHQHPVRFVLQGHQGLVRGGALGGDELGPHVVDARAAGPLAQLLDADFVHVQGVQVSPVLHLRGELQGLSARSRAGIHHARGRRIHQHAEQLAALVLQLQQPVLEALQGEDVDARLQPQSQGREGRGRALDSLRGQPPLELRPVPLEQVDARGERGALVHGLRGLAGVFPERLLELHREKIRQRGGDGEALGQGQCLQFSGGPGKGAEGGAVLGGERGGIHHRFERLAVEDPGGGQAQHVLACGFQAVEAGPRARQEPIHRALAAQQGVDPLRDGPALVGVQVRLAAQGEVQGPVGQAALVAHRAVRLQAGLQHQILAQGARGALEGRPTGGAGGGLLRVGALRGGLLRALLLRCRTVGSFHGELQGPGEKGTCGCRRPSHPSRLVASTEAGQGRQERAPGPRPGARHRGARLPRAAASPESGERPGAQGEQGPEGNRGAPACLGIGVALSSHGGAWHPRGGPRRGRLGDARGGDARSRGRDGHLGRGGLLGRARGGRRRHRVLPFLRVDVGHRVALARLLVSKVPAHRGAHQGGLGAEEGLVGGDASLAFDDQGQRVGGGLLLGGELLGQGQGVRGGARGRHEPGGEGPVDDLDVQEAIVLVVPDGAPRGLRDGEVPQVGATAAHHQVGDPRAGGGHRVALHRVGALVVVVMSGEDEVHPILLEEGAELPAHEELGAVVSARPGGVVEEDDLPRRLAGGEILLCPGLLRRQGAAVLRGQANGAVRVQPHEVHMPPVERVVALAPTGAGGQVEVVQVGLGLIRDVLVVARHREERNLHQQVLHGDEHVVLDLLLGAGLVGDIPHPDEEFRPVGEHAGGHFLLAGAARAEVPHGGEVHPARAGDGRGVEALGARTRAARLHHVGVLGPGRQAIEHHGVDAPTVRRAGRLVRGPSGAVAYLRGAVGVHAERDGGCVGSHPLQVGGAGERCRVRHPRGQHESGSQGAERRDLRQMHGASDPVDSGDGGSTVGNATPHPARPGFPQAGKEALQGQTPLEAGYFWTV
ncbi:LigA [Stigmatella aurantiaca DW4/3-1]|uniref:LigA n=1 Tax=Stigmatella aurantiaca (strain DW4/3-1) TaxID=378806 RepID=Q08X61_STIAD|nr:LigA [Stigmatella aurantiaca DW4/3-1]